MAYTDTSPADVLRIIIARGQAAYRATLPDYARGPLADVEPQPNISGVDEDRQRALCLSCELNDCVTIASPACPIRIEQRRVWRRNRQEANR